MTDRLLTPTKITAWLDCAHYLTLRHGVDEGTRPGRDRPLGEMAQLLMAKGLEHEQAVLSRYRAAGRTVFEVPDKGDESFASWAARSSRYLDEGHDVIFQMPFVHDGVRGVADFLERVELPDGSFTYEPVDAKLARAAAKPGHVLQLCFYADAITAYTGRWPAWLHIELGSGRRESVRFDEVAPYWRRLRVNLARVMEAGVEDDTRPEPCSHCAFCEFDEVCEEQWRAADSLVHIAGIRTTERYGLEEAGVDTIELLAGLDGELSGVGELDSRRVGVLAAQAALQVQARNGSPGAAPPVRLIDRTGSEGGEVPDAGDPVTAVVELVGFEALPAPDPGDVFFDIEGHPFFEADRGLIFLFGILANDDDQWTYRCWWAHDHDAEARAVGDLVAYLRQRRDRHPSMHVYHYNHTERTVLQTLASQHGVVEQAIANLVADGFFVDLYPVVTGALQAGVESYGLKHIERLPAFERGHEIDRGAGAVIEYEYWRGDGDEQRLGRIARYNDDDVRATRAVRDWLVETRPPGVEWRASRLDPASADPDLDARVEALHAAGPGTVEHLLGDLLGYWRREARVVAAEVVRLSTADLGEQLASPSVVAGLQFVGIEPGVTATGRPTKWPDAIFSFSPGQVVDPDIGPSSNMVLVDQPDEWSFFSVRSIDRDQGELRLSWTGREQERGLHPPHLVHWVRFSDEPKLVALSDMADRVLDGDRSGVALSLLERAGPRFASDGGPGPDGFVGDVGDVCRWALDLDGGVLPVQGPPGTGKTYTGSHLIRDLVAAGRRIGVTAMSHHAVDNLLAAVAERFEERGVPGRIIKKGSRGSVPGVQYSESNAACAQDGNDVIGGTAWLFASPEMRANPVDVLVIDEAGQLSLADAVAASTSARSVILLGDPLQLPQVAQAQHPNRSGVSVLGHVLGPERRVLTPDQGVLLDVTWRMHPDVGDFISETIYEGRLSCHPSCVGQATDAGTGLRWVEARHQGNSTASAEEAAMVAEMVDHLLGARWTGPDGIPRDITPADIMVVAPYNDQRRLVREHLEELDGPAASSVEVGTVDKFQGREAAVVIFTLATSAADVMPRGVDFLFSRQRLNVAVSRARCLAVVVCTAELLDTRARTIADMVDIATLCAFVEGAVPVAADLGLGQR